MAAGIPFAKEGERAKEFLRCCSRAGWFNGAGARIRQ